MSDYKCIKCESSSNEDTILNCPVYGKICPICGSSEISILKSSIEHRNTKYDFQVI